MHDSLIQLTELLLYTVKLREGQEYRGVLPGGCKNTGVNGMLICSRSQEGADRVHTRTKQICRAG